MKWIEVKITTTQEASDALAEMLMQAGAGGVAIEDPFDIKKVVQTPGSLDYADSEYLDSLGDDVSVSAYFHDSENIAELKAVIQEKVADVSRFLDTGKGHVAVREVAEENWSENWKQYYKPVKLSDGIVIKPSWEKYDCRPGETVVELDPGMAFGTGNHETTRMCAQLLEKYMKEDTDVLDIGCGSGILSIIAAKIGARSVLALDIDEVAVRVAGENCARNGVNKRVKCVSGVLDDLKPFKNGIIVANIIARVIVDLSRSIPHYIEDGGLFITSGIIRERGEEVKTAYLSRGFELLEERQSGEWVAMAFRCQGSL